MLDLQNQATKLSIFCQNLISKQINTDIVYDYLHTLREQLMEDDPALAEKIEADAYKKVGEVVPTIYIKQILAHEPQETALNEQLTKHYNKTLHWHLINSQGDLIDHQIREETFKMLNIYIQAFLNRVKFGK